jgi:pilus assembly protein Flp/PilA
MVFRMTTDPSSPMIRLLRRFLRNENGATAIEYALIAGIISVAVITGATSIGSGLSTNLYKAADGFKLP